MTRYHIVDARNAWTTEPPVRNSPALSLLISDVAARFGSLASAPVSAPLPHGRGIDYAHGMARCRLPSEHSQRFGSASGQLG